MTAGAPALLETIDAINPAWLGAVLREAGIDTEVEAIRKEPIGHGTTAAVVRLHVAYAAPGCDAPATLVAKFPKAAAERSRAPVVVEGFAREIAAYRAIGPAPSFRIPRCYRAAIGDEGVFNLVLEDLDHGCRPGDQIAGCSGNEALAVARELGGLHAAWWRGPGLDRLDWPRRRAPIAPRNAALYAEGALIMRARFAGRLGAAALDLIDAAVPLLERWYAAPPLDPTLIHADPRVDNIVFEGGDEGPRACLIDLQSMAIGDAANDLAYFLTGSLVPEERARCERAAVAAHAARVRSAGIDYPDDVAWARYRRYAIAGMAGTVMAAPLVPAADHADRLLLALATRNCAAVAELDGIGAAREGSGD